MNYNQLIKEFENKVKEANLEVNAVKWMFFYSGFNVGYSDLKNEVKEEHYNTFKKYIDLYINEKMPPQYILNKTCFYGYEYYVDENVFIPRNETEQLVEETILRIDRFYEDENIDLADVCCGSGVIGVTLKKEVENAKVIMCDINEKAIEIVNKNAKYLDADVKTLVGDFITPLLDNNYKFDVLVCNPPYIKNDEILDEMVVNHEPNNALFGGVDGLDFYKIIFDHYDDLIKEKGFMSFEFGYDQKDLLEKLIKEKLPNYKYEFLKDYAGLDRMLFIYKNLF